MSGQEFKSQPIANEALVNEVGGEPLCLLAIYDGGRVQAHHVDERVDVEEKEGFILFYRKGRAERALAIGTYSVQIEPPLEEAEQPVLYVARAVVGAGAPGGATGAARAAEPGPAGAPGSGPIIPPPPPPPPKPPRRS